MATEQHAVAEKPEQVQQQVQPEQQVSSVIDIPPTPTPEKPVVNDVPNLGDDSTLPLTLARLSTQNGSQVYIVGTAHFSTKSTEDVKRVIRAVKPSAVVLELCRERAFMLEIDEQSLLEQNKYLTFDKIKDAIRQRGLAQGLFYIMFIKISANITERLGLAPGSEFRAAAAEAHKIPGCLIVLGDRSLKVTVARAVASVTAWQKMKLFYQALRNDIIMTEEDVEKFKDNDMLEQLFQELGVEYPGFKKSILDERDVYLSHSIHQAAQHSEANRGPQRIVAVVGIGHVAGIVQHWSKTTDVEVRAINQMPVVSKKRKFVTKTIKYCSVALLLYVGYRVAVPSSIQNVIYNKITQKASDP